MSDAEDELEAFKRFNLTEYMASCGYALDRRSSSRNSAMMVSADGDKLIVAIGDDGHWVYFSVRNPADHGSIIDFVQHRRRYSLGEVRKILRPWTGTTPLPYRPAPELFAARLDHIAKDIVAVRALYDAMAPVSGFNRYLVEERKIPAELLAQPAFAGRIRVDHRGNVIFPHFDRDGLCGYEIKNTAFTGFAPGGRKGLWASVPTLEDNRLVIAETAIDALSFACLKGTSQTRFLSIGGQMNPEQPALLRSAIAKLPAESKASQVVLAFDNDDAGDAFTVRVTEIFNEETRPGLMLKEDRPVHRGADWNDILKGRIKPPFPSPTA